MISEVLVTKQDCVKLKADIIKWYADTLLVLTVLLTVIARLICFNIRKFIHVSDE